MLPHNFQLISLGGKERKKKKKTFRIRSDCIMEIKLKTVEV